jgi:hypothetical protein
MAAEPPISEPRMVQHLHRHARWLILIGAVTTAVGAVWLASRFLFLVGAVPAHGVVERVEQRADSSMWHARFTFSDLEGRRHTAETSFLSPTLCPSITVGNSVPVRYARNNPDDALIVTAATLWFGPGMLVALGVFFLTGGRLVRFVAQMTAARKFRRAGEA